MAQKNNLIATNRSLQKSSFVTEEQVRLLYMQAPTSNSVIIIISLLYYFILQPRLNSKLLLLWTIMLSVTAVYRMYLWYSWKSRAEVKPATGWLNYYLVGCGLVGGAWSLIYPLFYRTNDPFVLAALLMLAFGVISSAVPILSPYIQAFILYVFPQGLVLIVTLLRFDDAAYYWLAFAVGVYVIMTTLFTRNTNRSILQSIRLQEQNTTLIEDLNNEISQRETLIAERTADLDATLQAIPDLMFKLDENGKYLDIWTQNEELLAAQKTLLLGHTVHEMLPADAAHIVMAAIRDAAKNGISHGQVIKLPLQHGMHWFELSTSKKTHTDSSGIFLMLARDITDKHQMEIELRKSEERYRGIFNESIAAIYVFDEETNFIDSNQAGLDLLGYSRGELLCMAIPDVDATPDAIISVYNKLLGGGRINNYEHQLMRKDGKFITVLNNSKSLAGADGTINGLQSIFLDITEFKELGKQLQQAHKMEAIGTLAGGIAHDFNNILAAIIGYSEFIHEAVPADSPIRRDIEKVLISGKRAAELIKQILTFSRKTDSTKQDVYPHLLISEAMEMMRSTLPTSITIETSIDPDSGVILADPTSIHQIIVNLCTNASHAMPDKKGLLSVSLQSRKCNVDEMIGKTVLPPGDFVVLTVRDNGHGMDKTTMDRIFEPYFSTKALGDGTGLGLALVHGIVQDCNGFIDVESIVGEGSTFKIFFPVIKKPLSQPVVSIPKDKVKRAVGNERILIVDDELLLVKINEKRLQTIGYKVTGVTDSNEALSVFQGQPDNFDLLITDQTMPGLTGNELAEAMLAIKPSLPVIVCTGHSETFSKEEALSKGIKKYVFKPVHGDELVDAVQEIFAEK